VAADCFDANDKVDVERLRTWMEFLKNPETFREEPFCFIPDAELTRFQMHRVCECLVLNRNGARDRLNEVNGIIVSLYGKSILEAMVVGDDKIYLKPAVGVVASLFAPHRQRCTPTCAIDSLTNKEIMDHLDRLIPIYAQVLSEDQFTPPSGMPIKKLPIEDYLITADLENGGQGKDRMFKDIKSDNREKIEAQIATWSEGGMEYCRKKPYKLGVSVYNVNDVFFAHILQESDFGNKEMNGYEDHGVMAIYTGRKESFQIYSSTVAVDESKLLNEEEFLRVIGELKECAETERKHVNQYMRVATTIGVERIEGGYDRSAHAENINVSALLAFDPNNMEAGKAYPIGDRNCGALAVRRMDGLDGAPSTYEFGTVQGSTFENDVILEFKVFRE
jgi:hypothetical protein